MPERRTDAAAVPDPGDDTGCPHCAPVLAAVHLSPRGFQYCEPIPSAYGGEVTAYESSAASSPHLWLNVTCPSDLNDPSSTPTTAVAHLCLDDAAKLRDQLAYLIEHHYQRDRKPAPDAGDDTLRLELAEEIFCVIPPATTGDALKAADALLPRIREHTAAAVQAERERARNDRLLSVIFGTPADGPQPFVLLSDDDKPFAYGVQWPGGTVTVKAVDGSVMGNITSPSLEDHFTQYGKSEVIWLAEDLGTLADVEERAEKAEAAVGRVTESFQADAERVEAVAAAACDDRDEAVKRAEQAEAAIERVRSAVEPWQPSAYRDSILRALDGTEATP